MCFDLPVPLSELLGLVHTYIHDISYSEIFSDGWQLVYSKGITSNSSLDKGIHMIQRVQAILCYVVTVSCSTERKGP